MLSAIFCRRRQSFKLPMNEGTKNIPTILVIFGVTGDLATKKILPALFNLLRKGNLPSRFRVVGFSRRSFSRENFEKHIFEATRTYHNADTALCGTFCAFFSYQQGVFEKLADFHNLDKRLQEIDRQWGVCANKLFYLAVSPQFYEVIFKHLAASGLTKPCSSKEGWTRILVEKPFGKDLKTAENLEKLLRSLFKEIQIYRIDHYLAKEMVQNILAFRFSNNLFEKTWDKNSIEKVEIKLWEKIGVEERGSFYDGLGALRDVGQNHLLQIAALLAMDHPINFSAETIREKRTEMLNTLIAPGNEEIKKFTFRAQYDGYQNIKGVDPTSATETYFKVQAYFAHPRFEGVPFILEGGKRLERQIKEAVITFRHPVPCLCPKDETHYKNKITISLEPEEKITLVFWSKKPGLEFELLERDFSFLMRDAGKKVQYTEEYEKLLYDCIVGDQTLFVTSHEVQAMWRYTDPIIEAWQKNATPLKTYKPDTDQPILESRWIGEGAALVPEGFKKEIAIVGLGKMGANVARRLIEKGWRVYGYNRSEEATQDLEREGLSGAYSLKEIAEKLSSPRIVWLMVPAGKPVDEVLFGKEGLVKHLKRGDIVIDGGNSWYKDSAARFKRLKKEGIHFIDVGVSGGPHGARHGASLMIGGEKGIFQTVEPLFYDLSQSNGYQFFEGPGAGHFVKMIHNGIEYGMMQSIGEGFTILKKSEYKLNLTRIADVYNHGSVIESRLVAWLKNALKLHGESLEDVSGAVGHTGEGAWTVKTAKALNVKARIIAEALRFRVESEKNPSYTGKILSALRNQFGGHDIRDKDKKEKSR